MDTDLLQSYAEGRNMFPPFGVMSGVHPRTGAPLTIIPLAMDERVGDLYVYSEIWIQDLTAPEEVCMVSVGGIFVDEPANY